MEIDDSYIKKVAYQLWEAEGRPEGQEHKHWQQAYVLIKTLEEADELAAQGSATAHPKNSQEPPQPDQT